jgi:hypothetical protein
MAGLGLLSHCTTVDETPTGGEGGESPSPASGAGGNATSAGDDSGGADATASGGTPTHATAPDAGAGGEGGRRDRGADAEGGEGGEGEAAQSMTCQPIGQYCGFSLDCAWYERCEDQHCVAIAEGSPCNTDVDCGNAEYCDNGTCKNMSVVDYDCSDSRTICAPGSECYWVGFHGGENSESLQCIPDTGTTGYCDSGVIPCASDYYCPTDPDAYGATCVARGGLGEACVDEEARSCLPGLSCNFSKCQPADAPEGTSCEALVSAWTTALDRQYDVRYPRPCAEGLFCDPVAFNGRWVGVCTPQKPVGGSCGPSELIEGEKYQCLRGFCDNELKCAAPFLGSPCGYPDVCPAGTTCGRQGLTKEDKCVAVLRLGQTCGTAIVGICEPGTVCDAHGDTAGVCRAIVDEGEGCSDARCGDGTVCVEHP